MVLGAQFCNISSVHCIVCLPLQVKSLSITIYLPYTFPQLLLLTSGNPHTVVCVHEFFFFFAQSFYSSPQSIVGSNFVLKILRMQKENEM